MNNTIAILGATGNLGGRVIQSLSEKGAAVRAIVRNVSKNDEKIKKLEQNNVEVIRVDMSNHDNLKKALTGVSVVVSTLQGLKDVIVDIQSAVLKAAVDAGVSRFIPSDFSTDYTKLQPGENRNFDLRREFYNIIDDSPIKATSVFNGAFAEILAYSAPFIDIKNRSIGFWENPDWKVDVTSMDNTAAFTANVALDDAAPRKLLIAGFQISAKELQALASEVFGTPFTLTSLGSITGFAANIKRDRAAHPEGEKDIYTSWQRMQYLHSMFSAHHDHLDNIRYPGISWTDAKEILTSVKG
jgi:uncharacterized protein YbjT (DUF2867 family)